MRESGQNYHLILRVYSNTTLDLEKKKTAKLPQRLTVPLHLPRRKLSGWGSLCPLM